jgi:hypothetical protein
MSEHTPHPSVAATVYLVESERLLRMSRPSLNFGGGHDRRQAAITGSS